jgi:hypothetical protein
MKKKRLETNAFFFLILNDLKGKGFCEMFAQIIYVGYFLFQYHRDNVSFYRISG